MSIVLTEGQKRGLEIAVKRYRNGEKYTCIAGFAGTGKSETVRFIIAALGLKEDEVAYATYTGKAAMVLQQKGNKNAITLHKLLYKARLMPNGRYILTPKKVLPSSLKLIVVDEISMVPAKLIQQLVTHGIYVICLGDPFQLHPVSGCDNGILQNPHVMLTEIMRQAEESEIVRLSMNIRNGKPLEKFDGKDVKVIEPKDLVDGMFLWATQIISATNKTRKDINNFCRKQNGFEGLPKTGERILCVQNSWDDVAQDGTVLVNGLTGTIVNPILEYNKVTCKKDIVADFIPDFKINENNDNSFKNLRMDLGLFKSGEPMLPLQQRAALMKNKNTFFMVPRNFEYSYCMSGHKSQGSEYDKVLLFEENFPFSKEEHQRWLYTGITRAVSKLVVVRK